MVDNLVNLPEELWNGDFRFLKIKKGDKSPTADTKGWQKDNNFRFNDRGLLTHLANGGNYGIIGGFGNLVIIDSDSQVVTDLANKLPDTLTINTGSPQKYKKHFFFITEKPMSPIRFKDKSVGDLGDIRSTGQYVVGPNCNHPSGGIYEIEKKLSIAEISIEKLNETFSVLDKDEKQTEKEYEPETKLRSSRFIRYCNVPDYCRKNKLKGNTSKNWKLFPYIVDILHNRQSSISVYQEIIDKQGHNPGAIKGWIQNAREGKIAKCSCKKMREYLTYYHNEKEEEICKDCPLYKKIKKLKKIEEEENDEFIRDVLQHLVLKEKEEATEKIVKKIMKDNYIYSTRDDKNSEMWIYKEGVYIPEGKSYIKEFSRKVLGKAYDSTLYKKILDKIEADTYIDQDKFFKQNHKEEIPVENGILNIITRELKDFDPKKIFFNKLPVEYNPEAKCPAIDKHFQEVLKSDDDKEVLYEIIGFLLYKDYFLEKMFMFIGDGRNGKGKTLDLIKRFLGIENTCSVPLSALNEDSFRVSELFSKMVNLAGDLSNRDLKETGMLKMTTGRDQIGAKRKFKTDIKFVNYAKHIFACNELPRVYDTSEGFWSRWMLFEFPYRFVDQVVYDNSENKKNLKIKDPDHINKISKQEELNGLLVMALDGLDRIKKNKRFSYSKGTNEVKKFWIRKSDSFMAFCLDNLQEDDNNVISKKDIRKAFHKYCNKHKVKGVSDKSIKVTLEEHYGVTETREYDGETGKTTPSWVGIKFKEDSKYKYIGEKL